MISYRDDVSVRLRFQHNHLHNFQLAASYANNNDSASAIPHYAQALQLRPAFARGWLNLGISFANLDRHEEAAKSYAQALSLNPDARCNDSRLPFNQIHINLIVLTML